MSDLPRPQSYDQLLSDALSSYATKMGINDFNVGSAVTSFFEIVALVTARASGDVFQILRDFSVDRATGDALKRLALENRVKLVTAKPSTGSVTITDTTFEKRSTKVYSGASSPNIGSVIIKVSDASNFPTSGSIYIGRGTPNIEGPISYSSVTPVGGYFELGLNSATTKFHNIGETVILAQGGNRTIPTSSIVVSPSSGASPDIQFSVISPAVILDGEVEVTNVQVSALTPGLNGNVPRGAVRQFATAPFSGAAVTNPLPFTTGKDSETDDQLRVRIKRQLASKGLATATAVKSGIIGATPSDENATIVSSEIQNTSIGSFVFLDDGNGYEAKTSGVGLESIVDSALGGEKFFQLSTGGRQAPVAKAFLQSTFGVPFDLRGGDALAITVGETTFEHIFDDLDFRSPGGATAFEVTASINANTDLGFEATTAEGGVYVVFRAKEEGNDSLKVAAPQSSGRDASVLLGLPSNEIQTLRLFKNKLPLSKDGKTASVFTQNQQLWSPTIVTGDTLVIGTDSTANITYTITDGDFIATGLYTSVASTNSLESWLQVLNAKLTGLTVTLVGQQLKITSNLGAANRANVTIDPSSTLVTKGMFSTNLGLSTQGKASDFILSRNTAQFELIEALEAGDELDGGSDETEARLVSDQIPGGSVNFPSDAHVWMLIDSDGEIIPNGVAGNTFLAVSKPASNVVRYTSDVANAFENVQVGDYVIIWTQDLVTANRLEGRVNARTNNSFDILVTPAEYAAVTTTPGAPFTEGLVFVRTNNVPQKFRIQAGAKTLDEIAEELQDQTPSLVFTVLEEQYLVIRSRTKNTDGSVLIVTFDTQGKLLNLPANGSDVSKDSLIAFYDSQEQEADFPLFLHASFASGSAANPIDSYLSSLVSSVSLAGRDPNELMAFLHPYGGADDAQPFNEHVQQKSISGPTIGIENQPDLRRVRSVDRYFLANPLDFGFADTAIAVLDGDTSSKSFELPFYRRALTNTTLANNSSNFNAYDVENGSNTNFTTAFGTSFSFNNFKVLMQAKKVIKAVGVSQSAILYRSAKWGRSGEKINLTYIYPSVPNSDISHTVQVGATVDIRINLKSGATSASSHDSTTEWDVTITPNTPVAGIDQVTYTWNGTGPSPALALNGGEYVNIGSQTEFDEANKGVFRISTEAGFLPSATSFTVQRANGAAVAESDRATIVPSAIIFYDKSDTTAEEIKDYVNDSLSAYVTATLTNDSGTTGSGVIELATDEDSDFSVESYFLKDGINWLLSSNINGTPQFTFKKALDLPSDVGYTFNNGEEIRFVPTTMDQVSRLLSVLAVSGFTTTGTIGLVERANRLELATRILGSEGSVQVIGGTANKYQVPVLDTAIRVDDQYMKISADKVASQGVHSDQWFRLQATTLQRKEAGFSATASVNVFTNTPTVGQSTIKITGRQINERYFGKPRNHVRSNGRTFRIEKQGSLVCLSWDGTGTSPAFQKATVDFAATAGTLNVARVTSSSEVEYSILTGDARFGEMSISDLITISGLPVAANNGTFLVTGVSDDGLTIRVLSPNGENEFPYGTFTLNSNLTAGDTFTVGINSVVANTDFAIGATAADTAANLSAYIGTLAGVAGTVVSNVVTVTSTVSGASIALSFSGVGTVVTAAMAGDSYTSSTFDATTEVGEGDTLIIESPFAVLNQGRFRVIRRYEDSVWFENANVIEEEVTVTDNFIDLGFDGTTSFDVVDNNGSLYLKWNGTGTEPNLENAYMGDIMTFGTDFAVANQGEFMVRRSGVKLQEVTNFPMPAGSQFTIGGNGKYFFLKSAGDVNQYYVWFNVNASNIDPSPVGSGLQVAILSGDSAAQVAAKAAAIIGAAVGLDATSVDNLLTTTTTDYIETTAATNFNMPSPFTVNVDQFGRRTFVECINPSATSETTTLVTDVLTCDRPQMMFSEYEATVAGDSLVITGDTLTTDNAGQYTVVRTIDEDSIVISGTLDNQDNVSLNGRETTVFPQEGILYSGYKHVYLSALQPGAPTRNHITFDTNAQYTKVNEASGVQMVSLNKMDFSTVVKKGLDSYRYNTGLIAEANRIIYGDSRDPETYPGIGAAGAEIFTREPLVKRIQVAIDIRIATGIPFTQITEQIRTSVSSLINSNEVGQSIAISSIISVVNAIPGARAVAISSPQYDSTHDIIFLAPSEKARIIDPVLDVSVSQIGS